MKTPDEWKPLDSYREMKLVDGGKILVVRPSDIATVVPLFCPCCHYPMRTSEDSIGYRKSLSCGSCDLFCHGDKNSVRTEQWEEYLRDKALTSKPIIIFR